VVDFVNASGLNKWFVNSVFRRVSSLIKWGVQTDSGKWSSVGRRGDSGKKWGSE
jgi:hypothetical protein